MSYFESISSVTDLISFKVTIGAMVGVIILAGTTLLLTSSPTNKELTTEPKIVELHLEDADDPNKQKQKKQKKQKKCKHCKRRKK